MIPIIIAIIFIIALASIFNKNKEHFAPFGSYYIDLYPIKFKPKETAQYFPTKSSRCYGSKSSKYELAFTQ